MECVLTVPQEVVVEGRPDTLESGRRVGAGPHAAHGFSLVRMTVWESIALHTTRGVPLYKQAEVRLVQLGTQYDVVGLHFDELTAGQRAAVLAAHPRTNFKTGIVEAFSAGMRDKPETTIGTINADIIEATVPGYVRPNYCDLIQGSPFDS
jgi:hypothetical protein